MRGRVGERAGADLRASAVNPFAGLRVSAVPGKWRHVCLPDRSRRDFAPEAAMIAVAAAAPLG